MWGFEDWEMILLIICGTIIIICTIISGVYIYRIYKRHNNELNEELLKNNNRRIVITSPSDRYLSNSNDTKVFSPISKF